MRGKQLILTLAVSFLGGFFALVCLPHIGPGNAGAGLKAVGNGDVNGDEAIDIADAVYLCAYLFRQGPAPVACADTEALEEQLAQLSNRVDQLSSSISSLNSRTTATSNDVAALAARMAAVESQLDDSNVGIDYNSTWWGNDALPSTHTSLGSIVVAAPGPGTIYLTMNGSTNVPQGTLLAYGIGTSSSSPNVVERSETMGGSFTTTVAYRIGAGGNYRFYALAREVDPTNCCTVRVWDVNLVGLYVLDRLK